jgi:crotonobetainyl-CoA:carnitine CoA-transferase CaiB-like acyl-CoA transferase
VDWLARLFARERRDTWLERLRHARVPAGAVRNLQEVLADPVLAARGMVGPAKLRGDVPIDLMALPWRADGARPPLHLPPPALGEHTAAFRERFGG